jgi:hypothetical protein
MRGDFRDEARRFEDIDTATLARLELEDAIKYRERHGRLPDLVSTRAMRLINAIDLANAIGPAR